MTQQAPKKRITALVLAFLASFTFLGSAALAAEPVERTNTSALWFESWGRLSNATLKVGAPDGTQIDVFAASGTPTFHLRDLTPITDGVYRYELTAATDEMLPIKNQLDSGRGKAQKKEVAKSFQMGGFFIVTRGVITKKEDLAEE